MEYRPKIIHILPHSPAISAYDVKAEVEVPKWNSTNETDYKYSERIDSFPYWVCYFQNDWHVQVASETLKRTNIYELECWRPYYGVRKILSREVNGIKHRLFPVRRLRTPLNFFNNHYDPFKFSSDSIIRELRRESSKRMILVNLVGHRGPIPYDIAKQGSSFPIIGLHLGMPSFEFRYLKSNNFLKKFFLGPRALSERKILRGMDIIFAATKQEYKIISEYHEGVRLSHPIGIDFSDYKTDKFEARRRLGIPMEKKILLHVGRFSEIKGVYDLIDAHKKLREKYDIELFLIGGHESHPLYELCASSEATILGRIPRESLKDYYAASDVYLMLGYDPGFIAGGGIGTATIEALASETPVVGPHLIHYLGNPNEIGKISYSPNDSVKCIDFVLRNEKKYTSLAAKAKKHYSWDKIISDLTDCYGRLTNKYT